MAVLTSLGATGCSSSSRVQISFSQQEVQERVATKFPVEHIVAAIRLRFEQPVVALRPGRNDVALKLDLQVAPPLVSPRSGTATVSGALHYDPERKAFYAQDLNVETFELEGLPPATRDLALKAAGPVLCRLFNETPVYRLNDRNLKEVATARTLESVSVHDGTVVATLRLPR